MAYVVTGDVVARGSNGRVTQPFLVRCNSVWQALEVVGSAEGRRARRVAVREMTDAEADRRFPLANRYSR